MKREGTPNPELDLVLERYVDVPPHLVWRAWTEPEHLKVWFTPAPWTTADASIDPRPGGAFSTTMRSPEGEEFSGTGCVLEAIEDQRLVWTEALGPGFRPVTAGPDDLHFTAVITMEARGDGTDYRALVMHADAEGREKHAAMGFLDGWGAALDQLVEHAKAMAHQR